MFDIELKITKTDWFFIVVAGFIFGMMMSGYFDGFSINNSIFGGLLGLNISLFATLLISFANSTILPKINKKYWFFVALLFSFMSGFLGSIAAIKIAQVADFSLPFKNSFFVFSILNGITTCFIGALLHRFVKMRNENEKISKTLLKNRLVSLETQLNPHFLFNAINSIIELMHKDKNLAEKSMLEMSEFLRSVMNEKSLISYDDEIRNIKRYVALENIRCKNQIELFIEQDSCNVLVPKFSIGLIVENAIKHGKIANENLKISILISEKQDYVDIFVTNNGAKIDKLQYGIGLKNLNERLKILCGSELSYIQGDKVTFCIRLIK